LEPQLHIALKAALEAGKAIKEIYEAGVFEIEDKDDNSPLTTADRKANEIINEFLSPTGIPIISEENQQLPFRLRSTWTSCWVVDPLDGTKEFIKRNGEFTVNISLVSESKPVLGVIFAPALSTLYFAETSSGKAYICHVSHGQEISDILQSSFEIKPSRCDGKIIVVGSRSHMDHNTLEYIKGLSFSGDKVEMVSRGSSLKFCLMAEGAAHIYPRFAPTMEWDTAAGQAICEAVGLKCILQESGQPVTYNRENLLNSSFLVCHER